MKEPDFLFVGFQKSGTTTIYSILKKHSGIALCRDVKEPMLYRIPLFRDVLGKKCYLKRYYGHISPDDHRIVGEVNAGLTFNGCAKRIERDFPHDIKIIAIVRDPVKRAYSAYKYFLTRGFLPLSVMILDQKYGHAKAFDHYVHSILGKDGEKDAVMKKRMKYLVFSQSRYASCLKEYTSFIPAEKMKLVVMEEFFRNPAQSYADLYQYMGADFEQTDFDVRANEGNERAVNYAAAKFMQTIKGIRYLFEIFDVENRAPRFFARYQRMYYRFRTRFIVPDKDNSAMLPETREILTEYFMPEVEKLEYMFHRNLKEIWGYDDVCLKKPDQSSLNLVHSANAAETTWSMS